MSPRREKSPRRLFGAAARAAAARASVALASLALASCGFHPLYGTLRGGEESLQERLSAIEIAPSSSGKNNILEAMLTRRFGRQDRVKGRYVLHLDVAVKEQDLFIRTDAKVTRQNVIYAVRYRLEEKGRKRPVFRDYLRATTAYNRRASQFETLAAQRAAWRRAAIQAAEAIQRRVVLFLRAPKKPPPAAPPRSPS